MRVFCFLLLILSPALSWAQSSLTDGVLINADVMDRDTVKRVVRLKGNVQVVFQGQHLSCDKAVIDLKKEQLQAEGNVILYNEKVHVEGDKVIFNYKQNTGFIYGGFVQSGQVVFEGDVIQKMTETRYVASNGSYTACETCPPGWSFSGRTIDAEIGGYARIRRPIFRIGGFPVLILPSLIVPLKSARQSGFLVPSLEFSGKGGAAFGQSYFWAIDRSRDLTFTPKYYQLRGLKTLADYRYVLSENSKGDLRAAWIQDKQIKEEFDLGNKFDRWFVWYSHRHEMPDNFVHRADLKSVSDLRYPRDFPLELTGHGDPALENKMSITKFSDDNLLTAEVDLYTNLLKADPLSDNSDAVHRFPEIRYSLKEQSLWDTGFLVNFDLNYVNFAREKYGYDDLKSPDGVHRTAIDPNVLVRDGQFDRGTDLLRTGQRLDMRPTIAYPFQIAKMFDIFPAMSFRETQYRFSPTESAEAAGFSPTAARRYLQADLQIKTEFSRVFGSDETQGIKYKHSVEPELGYSQILWKRTPNHPFFGKFKGLQFSRQFDHITDEDLNIPPTGIGDINTGVQFDYQDRTYDKQLVDFGITNRLTKKTFINGMPEYRTVAIFRLSQSYDVNEAKSDTPHPWSSINALADMRFDRFETYTTAQYNGYARVTNLSSRIKVLATPKQYVQVNYTRTFTLNNEYGLAANGETRNFGWGVGTFGKYFEVQGQIDYDARQWREQSFAYAIAIRPPGKCWLIKFEQRLIVGGDIDSSGAVSFDFGGETPPKAL